jgi:uncharacterized protein (TIGR02145 family)
MKTHFFSLLLLAAVFAGCSKNEDNPEPKPEPPVQQVLTVAPESIDATIVAGTYTLAITSTQAWTAEVDAAATWCAISPNASFGDGTATVSVVADNPVPQVRVATITFTSGTLTATVSVTQADAVPILEVDKTEIPAEGYAADYVIAITSNTAWTATVNSEAEAWCVLADASTAGNGTITVNVTDNTTMEVRTATVSISAGTGALTRQVVVTQAFMPVFTDPRDGNQYSFVEMPDGKIWFAENLRYTKDLTWNQQSNMANGVSFTTDDGSGVPAIGSYWCPAVAGAATTPDQNSCTVYGALYTWETAMMVDGKWSDETKTSSTWDDAWVSDNYYNDRSAVGTTPAARENNARSGRGICPEGWHIPTEYEWVVMLDAINNGTRFRDQSGIGQQGDNDSAEGAKLKSTSTYTGSDPGDGSWYYENGYIVGTDIYGFRAVPGGYRSGTSFGSGFYGRGMSAFFSTSSAFDASKAWNRSVNRMDPAVNRGNGARSVGMPVRCIKD